MTNKFHINPETGNPGVCRAKKTCPYGDLTEDHYDTKEDARAAYEKKTIEMLAAIDEKKAISDEHKVALDNTLAEIKALQADLRESGVTPEKIDKLEELEKLAKEQTNTFRDAVYETRIVRRVARKAGLFREEELAKEAKRVEDEAARAERAKTAKPKKPVRLSFDEENEKNDIIAAQELAAWSSKLTVANALNEIKSYDPSSGLTRDQYVVSLFQKHSDSPRPIAFLDLETSGFTPSTGEIIEVGIVLVDEKGNVVKEVDERFDLADSEVRRQLGTGNVDVHKIEREDLEGKRTFSDPEVQKELGAILNDRNTIICAHNAPFERRWLNHYLDGFSDVHEENSPENLRNGTPAIPIQDTQIISKMLMHSTDNDRLESFSAANGVPYVDSHSAFPDAQMTQRAYSSFRKSLAASPLGQRPDLREPAGA